jgi:hypothetical protein
MSETWTSLLAALVGAIVGGAASLAGTMLVNKQQFATNARMRMYDDLLPRLQGAIADFEESPFSEAAGDAAKSVADTLAALRRASAMAGGKERSGVSAVEYQWRDYREAAMAFSAAPLPPPFVDENSPTIEEIGKENQWKLLELNRDKEQVTLRLQISALSDTLEAKLG